MMLAQMEPDIHWPDTIKVIVGLVGLLSIVWLILSVAIACRKLFGKHPPIHEELIRLRKEFTESDAVLLAAIKEEAKERQKAITAINESRAKTLSDINEKISDLQTKLGQIPGEFMALLANARNILTNGGGK